LFLKKPNLTCCACFGFLCRHYRRQVDILERQKSDLQNEVELLKQRYYSSLQSSTAVAAAAASAPAPAPVPEPVAPVRNTAMSSRVRFDLDGRVVSTQGESSAPPEATTWPPAASTSAPLQTGGIVYPSVLSSSATDISDVLSALSGTSTTARPAGRSGDRFSNMNDSLSSASSGGSSSSDGETSTERRLREMLSSAITPVAGHMSSSTTASTSRRTSATVNTVHTIGGNR
jgi:hypothetical protein